MARTYIGENLVRKVIFVEGEDWSNLEKSAKEEGLTVNQYLRKVMAKLSKFQINKNQAKPVLEHPGEAQN